MGHWHDPLAYPCSQCVLESQPGRDTGLTLLIAELLAQHDHILFLYKNKSTAFPQNIEGSAVGVKIPYFAIATIREEMQPNDFVR